MINEHLIPNQNISKEFNYNGSTFIIGRLAPYECMLLHVKVTEIFSLLDFDFLNKMKEDLKSGKELSEVHQKNVVKNFSSLSKRLNDTQEVEFIVNTCLLAVQKKLNGGASIPILIKDGVEGKYKCSDPGLGVQGFFSLVWEVLQWNVFTVGANT